MAKALIYMIAFALDAFFPPRGSEALARALTLDDLFALSSATGELRYRDARVRALVWEVKYRGNRRAAALAGEFLADTLLALRAEVIGEPLLIPVPMHPRRRAQRGHNQTELLCEAALPHLGGAFAYAPRALVRTRASLPQRGLMRGLRLRNAKNTMAATAAVRGRTCVVVDDVSTTGATLAEARRALVAAGAREVHTVSLAVTE